MLKIKLSRRGKKKQPYYRILVMEHSKDPWGDYLENLGTYNPRTEPNTVDLKEDRIKYWISKGAQPSDTVHNILVTAGVIEGKKRAVSTINKKRQAKAEEADKAKKEASSSAEATEDKEKPAEEPKAKEPKDEDKVEEEPAEDTPTDE